ncbi:hypothetical protein [Acidiferrobacter sp.]|jgi:hypothetical protein|uniref:hypothetical protein n=1 Tax=Acidiferrobacter sp. TaxID=1872107 RepID=UPI002615FE52|nr:hypothetical protein [Acidiferrobacter sp.]
MTAKVAPYLEAIRKARDAGFTWSDIARAIGASNGETVRRAVRICKYKTDQIPIPERRANPETPALVAARSQNQPRALPGQQKKTDAQALADLAAAGVTVVN